ncbi:MAG: ABC transporter substrate-binding protein [Bacteroidota bacterium]
MRYLIGIDDTDNLESRGTGYRARMMAAMLLEKKAADILSIFRHQLLFDSRIPYTSHNSSASFVVDTDNHENMKNLCSDFLLRDCAPGSDAGLCIATYDSVDKDLIKYGLSAKKEILNQEIAKKISSEKNIYLVGLTGTRDGIIGSLAAVGLRKYGNDGRGIWIKGKELRDFNGIVSTEELFGLIEIDEITDMHEKHVAKHSRIFIDNWIRPVIKNNKIRIIVQQEITDNYEFRIAPKDYIKSISD